MASNYDFRVIINTVSGSNISYGTASLVSVQPNTSLVVNTNTMVDKINTMKQVQVFNGKTHTTASSLFDFKTFPATFFSGSTGIDTDYQYLSASIKGNSESGSILFHANDTPTAGGDFIKRYKFFGNKVCNVLGVPENYWIYADKFRLTNTGSESNYISGDILAQSLHLKDNFAISNAGAIESDLPMKHAKDTDRWIKWTDVSSSIPQNDMLIGYSNQNDRYEIRMQSQDLLISSSLTTASGDFKVEGNVIATNIRKDTSTSNQIEMRVDNRLDLKPNNTVAIRLSDELVVLNKDTQVKNNLFALGDITASSNIKADGDIVVGGDISASGNLFVGDGFSSTDKQTRSKISCYSNDANNIMIVQSDSSINPGQYIGGIGFVGSDGANTNSHPTSSNSAIMSRAALIHTSAEQATGLEFRIKNIDKFFKEKKSGRSINFI